MKTWSDAGETPYAPRPPAMSMSTHTKPRCETSPGIQRRNVHHPRTSAASRMIPNCKPRLPVASSGEERRVEEARVHASGPELILANFADSAGPFQVWRTFHNLF